MTAWFRYWGPVCAYAGLIFYLSSLPHPEDNLPSFTQLFSDKFLHLVEYAVLGGLCYRALRWGSNDWLRQWAGPLALLLTSLYGLSDEVHQSFVPFRDSSWLDWVADSIGGILGVATIHRLPSLWAMGMVPGMRSRR